MTEFCTKITSLIELDSNQKCFLLIVKSIKIFHEHHSNSPQNEVLSNLIKDLIQNFVKKKKNQTEIKQELLEIAR